MSNLKLLTTREVEEILGVQKRSIYQYIYDGKLEAIKIGQAWRFRPETIEAFIAEREVKNPRI